MYFVFLGIMTHPNLRSGNDLHLVEVFLISRVLGLHGVVNNPATLAHLILRHKRQTPSSARTKRQPRGSRAHTSASLALQFIIESHQVLPQCFPSLLPMIKEVAPWSCTDNLLHSFIASQDWQRKHLGTVRTRGRHMTPGISQRFSRGHTIPTHPPFQPCTRAMD